MRMFKKENFDYDFEPETCTFYRLKISVKVKGKTMQDLFFKVLKETKKKAPQLNYSNMPDDPLEATEHIVIPERFIPLIKVAVNKLVRIVDKEKLNPDKIFIHSSKLEKCEFVKKKPDWELFINYSGTYLDKR
jgi:hypothetical protein